MRNPVRRMRSDPLANGAAERQAAERKLRNPQRIGEAKHITAQLFNGVLTRRSVRGAVPARVVAQDLKAAEQIRHLRLPHAVVRANGMRQNQDGKTGGPFRPIETACALNRGKGQGYRSFSGSWLRPAELVSRPAPNCSAEPKYCSGASSCCSVAASRCAVTSGISASTPARCLPSATHFFVA